MPALAAADYQPTLFGDGEPTPDHTFAGIRRVRLDRFSWIDHLPRWVSGAESLFSLLIERVPWAQRQVVMYDRQLPEPRLTAWLAESDGLLESLPVLGELQRLLSARYALPPDERVSASTRALSCAACHAGTCPRPLNTLGLNLYRDGNDSVAWHADRNGRWHRDPIVALVSLGSPRMFRVRRAPNARTAEPQAAAPSFLLGPGDLLVMGGACQHDWEHCIPKVARAGPRISVVFRHG